MRAEHAQVPQPRSIAPRVRRLVHPVQFQGEEQRMGGDRGDAFAHGLVEFTQRGIGRIPGEQQPGIRPDAPEDFVNSLVFRDRHWQLRRGQLPLEGRRERLRRVFGPSEIGF